jgi:hypothetical protein
MIYKVLFLTMREVEGLGVDVLSPPRHDLKTEAPWGDGSES